MGAYRVARLLLETGAQVDLKSIRGWTALMSASLHGSYKVAKLLLDKGAEVDLQDISGWSALMFASRQGKYDVAKLLLDHKASVDLQSNQLECALSIALHSCSKIVELFQDKDVSNNLLVSHNYNYFPSTLPGRNFTWRRQACFNTLW